MATKLFHELYHKAAELDCSAMTSLEILQNSRLGPGDSLIRRVETVDTLRELRTDFLDSTDGLSIRFNPRYSHVRYRCVVCGDPYCINADMFEIHRVPV